MSAMCSEYKGKTDERGLTNKIEFRMSSLDLEFVIGAARERNQSLGQFLREAAVEWASH